MLVELFKRILLESKVLTRAELGHRGSLELGFVKKKMNFALWDWESKIEKEFALKCLQMDSLTLSRRDSIKHTDSFRSLFRTSLEVTHRPQSGIAGSFGCLSTSGSNRRVPGRICIVVGKFCDPVRLTAARSFSCVNKWQANGANF